MLKVKAMIFKTKSTYDWMVVGLGNPGIQYEATRHNVGFMTVDLLAENNNCTNWKLKNEALCTEYRMGDKRILLVKPQTYMNNSGRAVQKISAFYKIPCDKMIIIFDDISLDVGSIRMRRKGSHGGHNGMRDIIELLGKEDIMRIKIGVGAKPHPDYSLADWVLSKFPKSDEKNLKEALTMAASAVGEIITRGIDSAMNKFNS